MCAKRSKPFIQILRNQVSMLAMLEVGTGIKAKSIVQCEQYVYGHVTCFAIPLLLPHWLNTQSLSAT